MASCGERLQEWKRGQATTTSMNAKLYGKNYQWGSIIVWENIVHIGKFGELGVSIIWGLSKF